MKILVTGFDPFGGEAINPAWEAVSRLPKEIEGAEIVTVQIPTVFGDSAKVLFEAVEQQQPDAVVCVGQAGGRFGITPERVAINVDDARIADNKDQQPLDTVIQADGAPAYFTTLPVKAMVEAVKACLLAYLTRLGPLSATILCIRISIIWLSIILILKGASFMSLM